MFAEEGRKAKLTSKQEYAQRYYENVRKPQRDAMKPAIIKMVIPASTTPTTLGPEKPRRPAWHIADERIIMAGVQYQDI